MRKVMPRNLIFRNLSFGWTFLLTFSISLSAQDGDPAKGKQLFNTYCAACHNLDKRMTGPALRGVGDKYDSEWLYSWIKNSSAMVRAGDPQAVAIFEEYNGSVMTAFPQLSNEDIDNIISYTMEPAPENPAGGPVVTATPVGGSTGGSGISNTIILGALALVFGILIVMLFLVNKTLRSIAEANGLEVPAEEKEKRLPLWKAFAQNQFLVLVTAVFFLLASPDTLLTVI